MHLHQTELVYTSEIKSRHRKFKLDMVKVMTVKNMPKQKTVQEVSRLLGMANYLSRFIPNVSEEADQVRDTEESGKEAKPVLQRSTRNRRQPDRYGNPLSLPDVESDDGI